MAKIIWKNGKTPDQIMIGVRDNYAKIRFESMRALDLCVSKGGARLQDLLELATTKTGDKRVQKGGISAGRHETGNMIASVGNDGDHPDESGNIVMASFGWFVGEYEAYFRDQDLGEGNIPAAGALAQAFLEAREDFRRRMRNIVRGGSAD